MDPAVTLEVCYSNTCIAQTSVKICSSERTCEILNYQICKSKWAPSRDLPQSYSLSGAAFNNTILRSVIHRRCFGGNPEMYTPQIYHSVASVMPIRKTSKAYVLIHVDGVRSGCFWEFRGHRRTWSVCDEARLYTQSLLKINSSADYSLISKNANGSPRQTRNPGDRCFHGNPHIVVTLITDRVN